MLARADRHDAWLGSFLTRFEDTARKRAAEVDAELGAGIDRGPLDGVPVGVKNLLPAQEGPTTAQSLVLDRAWGAGRDAPIVRRPRDAGAVVVGKTTTMEFAIGMFDDSKPFPTPVNPWNPKRWPGGSSGGSGNGVAAGFFLAGIGTDTGGSIRIPAACCGVSGLMPTVGRVSKSGYVPLGYSLDHVGPLARRAWDCAAMLQALAGHDPSDPCSADRPVPLVSGADYVQAERVRRVGQRELAELLADIDVLVAPTASSVAQPLGSKRDGSKLLGGVHTPYWHAVGNPVLAVPIGFDDGLPVSMQLAAAPFAEATILRAGRAYQEATDRHLRPAIGG